MKTDPETHLKYAYGGEKFQCPECDYVATQKWSPGSPSGVCAFEAKV